MFGRRSSSKEMVVDVGQGAAPAAGEDGGATGLLGCEEGEDVAEDAVRLVAQAIASSGPLR
jgi:hypothetical protein